jgi:hypothetical protein
MQILAKGSRMSSFMAISSGFLLFLVIAVLTPKSAEALPNPTLIWSRNVSGHIVQSSPSVIDLDGGTKDIVVGAWDSKVYGVRGENGVDAAGWPVQTAKPIDSSAAVADVDFDGLSEIFIGSGDASSTCAGGGMYSFARNGGMRFHFRANDLVSTGGNSPCNDLAIHGSPAIADLNYDNVPDLTFTSLGVRSWMLDSNGKLNWAWPFHWDDTQFSSPALGDINNDGRVDAVFTGDSSPGGIVNHRGGLARAISSTGQELWRFYTNEALYSSPVIGDVDGDGYPEIVFGAGDFYANNGGSNDSNKVFVLNRFGQVKWARDLGARTLAAPTLADFNGDGVLDIGIGTWQGTQAGKIYAMNGVNGGDLTGYPRSSGGNLVIGQISTADFDNDGGQDILTTTGGGVYCYSGKTGALLFTVKNFGSFQNAPLIDDLDGDGLLDIVIAGSPDNVTGVIERYEMPAGSTGVLGSNGWPKFRKDARQTGSWLSAPLQNPNAFAARSQLAADQTVQVYDGLMSPNGQNFLRVNPDGNLVLYRYFNNIPWASRTADKAKQLIMQADGNLVLYNAANGPIWSSGTGGNPGSKLVLQDDGNLVIYNGSNSPIWFTGTYDPNWQTYVNNTMYGGSMMPFQEMKSADGRYKLVMQKDGNLVLYSPNRPIWWTGTGGKQQSKLTLQSDGNLVVYGYADQPIFWTGTNQRSKLIVQDDGNLVLYNGLNHPIWSSGTGGQL